MELKIYDSMSYAKCTYAIAINTIKNFKERLGYGKLPLVVKKMRVPQQGKTLRCGFFVLRYIYLLIRENSFGIETSVNWFDPEQIPMWKSTLFNLMKIHKEKFSNREGKL
jgi:hypothetical protein